jgi:3-hydroxybutyryl-CoA dehydrogenase
LDVVLAVMTGLFEEWGDDRYRPTPLLRRMVLAGQLGEKSGRGFYDYERVVPE